MIDPATVVHRLRTDPELVDAGVDVLLDHALAQPLRDALGPAETLASKAATALRNTAANPELAPWIARELAVLRGHIKPEEGSVADALPPALPAALAEALGRPFTPGHELVRAAINHAAMRSMMRSVLQSTLLEFGKKMWSALPDTRRIPGAGFRSRLMDMAKGVASVVGTEVERQLDDRVNSFVDGALANTIDMVIDRISDPKHSAEMAAWRADSVTELLQQPQVRYIAELDKIAHADVAADALALLRAIAEWEGLEGSIRAGLGRIEEALGERSLADVLEGSGLVESWRPLIRERLADRARSLITSEAFAGWIAQVVEGLPTSA